MQRTKLKRYEDVNGRPESRDYKS